MVFLIKSSVASLVGRLKHVCNGVTKCKCSLCWATVLSKGVGGCFGWFSTLSDLSRFFQRLRQQFGVLQMCKLAFASVHGLIMLFV